MPGDYEKSSLPAIADVHVPELPANHSGGGYTFSFAGIPIPLRRTFGAIDKLIAIPIEVAGEALEKKLKGNVESHVESVQKQRKKKGKKESLKDPSVRTARAIAEWATEASSYGPEEPELSAVWRAVLDEILDENDNGEELLRIVRSIPIATMRQFLRLFRNHGDANSIGRIVAPTDLECLKSAGLIERSFKINWIWITAGAIVVLIFFRYFMPRLMPTLPQFFLLAAPYLNDIFFPATCLFIGGGVVLYQFSEPSVLGRRLIELFKEYN